MAHLRVFKRNFLHFKRYKTVVLLTLLGFASISFFFGIMYPGDEALESYVAVRQSGALGNLLGVLDVENPGYFFWILINNIMMLELYLPMVGIFLGVKLLPFPEKEGKEYFLATPFSAPKQFIENTLLSIALIWLIFLPSYLVTLGFLYINDVTDATLNITIGYVIGFLLAAAFMMITAFGSILTFSKSMGYKVGVTALILSFLFQMMVDSQENLAKLSLIYRAKINQRSFEGTWDSNFILLSVGIVVILLIAAVLLLNAKDYMERGLFQRKVVQPIESSEPQQDISSGRKFLKNPVKILLKKIGWRFPAVQDQFYSSAGLLIGYVLFSILMVIMIVQQYPGEEEMEVLLSGFNSPIFQATMFGRLLHGNLESYLALEYFAFGWIIFGPFILIAANDLVTRDYKNYADITWHLPKSQAQILRSRTIAVIFYFILIFLTNLVFLLLILNSYGYQIDLINILGGFFVATWAYCVSLVFFIAVSMIPSLKHAQKALLGTFGLSIILLVVAFLREASWVRYLSPFGYFDIIGVLIGELTIQDILLEALTCTSIAIILFISVLQIRVPAKDVV